MSPVGSVAASVIAGKYKVPPLYLIIVDSDIQGIGFSLLSMVSGVGKVSPAQYGYQVICGFGVGMNISTLLLMTPFSVKKRDHGEYYI